MTAPLSPRPFVQDRFVRHECKYVIPERLVSDLVRFISPYVEPDPFTSELGSYYVNTLYFDSRDLWLYRETVEGVRKRFKLRARGYGADSVLNSESVFLEVKRRENELVHKSRARVPNEALQHIVSGRAPDLQRLSEQSLGCYAEFVSWMDRLVALPAVHVRYLREAWVGTFQSSVRVTIDRDIRCASARSAGIADADLEWTDVEQRAPVLELKFDAAFPRWMDAVVHRFDLQRTSFSKYGNSVRRSIDPVLRHFA